MFELTSLLNIFTTSRTYIMGEFLNVVSDIGNKLVGLTSTAKIFDKIHKVFLKQEVMSYSVLLQWQQSVVAYLNRVQ